MEIKKTKSGTRWLTDSCGYDFMSPVFTYAVHYKGFVASGPDLGECIGRCYVAANQH